MLLHQEMILDCTLRDGGYTNNWQFTKEQVVDTYVACKNSNIEFCEVGFRRTKIDPQFGVWYSSSEELINDTLSEVVDESCKLAIMAQMGTFTIDDFVPKSQSLISMVRVLIAYHCKDKDDSILDTDILEETCVMVEALKKLGYIVTVNTGRIDKMTDIQVITTCKTLSKCEPDYLYIADTYGHVGIGHGRYILSLIKNNFNGKIGYHAHDNLLNASVKTIDALYNYCDLVDVTIHGMGRGSGNAKAECVVAHFVMAGKKTYNILPILEYGEKWFKSYKDNHVLYLVTGMYSMHVNYAIHLIENHSLPFRRCYDILMEIVHRDKNHFFDEGFLNKLVRA
jgi:4-hydroxy 2-oxovalerate aldolase